MTQEAPFTESVPSSARRAPLSARSAHKDILARLKLETASEHEAIEAATRLMHPLLSSGEYRDYLELSYAFYVATEPLLTHFDVWQALQLKADERSKLPLLAADLADLGRDPGNIAPGTAPLLRSLPEAVGAVYVLEGSTLGGRVISRHVQQCLGPHVPRRFLDCYGSHTGAQWQAFRNAVTRFARSRDNDDAIIAGAKETFRAFTRLLTHSTLQGHT